MGNIKKVTIEYEDEIWTLEEADAMKWHCHNLAISVIAEVHGMNMFKIDPVRWVVVKK